MGAFAVLNNGEFKINRRTAAYIWEKFVRKSLSTVVEGAHGAYERRKIIADNLLLYVIRSYGTVSLLTNYAQIIDYMILYF